LSAIDDPFVAKRRPLPLMGADAANLAAVETRFII
jgi:hypothetical protein